MQQRFGVTDPTVVGEGLFSSWQIRLFTGVLVAANILAVLVSRQIGNFSYIPQVFMSSVSVEVIAVLFALLLRDPKVNVDR